jgi:hypothetical protein
MIIIIYNNRIPQNGFFCPLWQEKLVSMLPSELNARYCLTNTGLRFSMKARTASL